MALHPEKGNELETWVLQRMLQILSGRASLVAAGMRRSATNRNLPPQRRKAIDKAASYLLRYDTYLAGG